MAELQPEGPAVREESRDPASHPPPDARHSLSGQNRRKSMLFDDFYHYLQLIFEFCWDQEDIDYWIKGRRGREK